MTWRITGGGDGRSYNFPVPISTDQVRELLNVEQRAVLDQYRARLNEIDQARHDEVELRTAERFGRDGAVAAAAREVDRLAAIEAARAHEGVAPEQTVYGVMSRRDRVAVYCAALEALAGDELGELHDVLVPVQDELLSKAWAMLDADKGTKPDVTRRLVTAVLWALQLHDGSESPRGDRVMEALANIPTSEQLRAQAGEVLDQLGERVAADFTQRESEVV